MKGDILNNPKIQKLIDDWKRIAAAIEMLYGHDAAAGKAIRACIGELQSTLEQLE